MVKMLKQTCRGNGGGKKVNFIPDVKTYMRERQMGDVGRGWDGGRPFQLLLLSGASEEISLTSKLQMK